MREWAVIGPLCALSIVMGVVPNLFLAPMEPAVDRIVQRLEAREPMRVERRLALVARQSGAGGRGLAGEGK